MTRASFSLLCTALCALLISCTADDPVSSTQAALSAPAASSSLPAPHAPEQKKGVPSRARVITLEPDEVALRAHATLPPSLSLPEGARERLARAPLPALLPGDEALLRTLNARVGQSWYTGFMALPTHSVYIMGTRTTHEHDRLELDAPGDALTQQPYVISRTHQVVTLSFTRFGLGYHIDVECAKPMSDVRCLEDDYVRRVHDSLALYKGGQP